MSDCLSSMIVSRMIMVVKGDNGSGWRPRPQRQCLLALAADLSRRKQMDMVAASTPPPASSPSDSSTPSSGDNVTPKNEKQEQDSTHQSSVLPSIQDVMMPDLHMYPQTSEFTGTACHSGRVPTTPPRPPPLIPLIENGYHGYQHQASDGPNGYAFHASSPPSVSASASHQRIKHDIFHDDSTSSSSYHANDRSSQFGKRTSRGRSRSRSRSRSRRDRSRDRSRTSTLTSGYRRNHRSRSPVSSSRKSSSSTSSSYSRGIYNFYCLLLDRA